MRLSHPRLALLLMIYALLLLVAIFIGTSIGNRIWTASQGTDAATSNLPTPVPNTVASLSPAQGNWKRVQVVSVATDPAFPDPRFTPTPVPTPVPTPTVVPKKTSAPHSAQVYQNLPPWDLPRGRGTAAPHARASAATDAGDASDDNGP